MKKLNRYELARQFNVHEDVARAVCVYFDEDEDRVKNCLSNKDSYLRVCRLQKWKKQLSAEDFEYVQSLSDAEAKQFVRKKSLERKHGSLENFYKEQDEKRKATLLEKYGRLSSFDTEKSKQTKLEKYGDVNYNNSKQASETRKGFSKAKKEAIQEKREATLVARYGSENYRNVEKWRETISQEFGSFENYVKLQMQKAKQTKLTRYGDENYTNSRKAAQTKKDFSSEKKAAIREKTKQTNLKRYGVSCPFLSPELSITYPGHVTKPELDLRNFVQTLGVEFKTNCRNVIGKDPDHPLELDIYIPEYKVAIEYDGLFWHSELYKPNNYHQLKSDLCREKGIRLIHIFGDDWFEKRAICESIIKSSLGIYNTRIFARKCTVKEVDSKTYRDFLNTNHVQGALNSSIRLGLYFKEELVQVIGVGKSRFEKDTFELHRMCTKLNTQVIGGFSKLLAHCKLPAASLTTYVDLALFDGKGYEKVGFTFLHKTSPNYWYLNKGCNSRLSRQACQKHKLRKLLGESFDSNLTEVENMHKAGFVRFFDSGTFKLQKK